MQLINLQGRRFSRLVVKERARNKNTRPAWLCLCDCGKTTITTGHDLKAGKVGSCGCLKQYLDAVRCRTHGMSGTPELQAFYAAKTRCNNPNTNCFKDYGARGIKFLYRSFEEFFVDVGKRPSAKHSLGRINNDGNYEPKNCQWETRIQQFRNRRIAVVSEKDLITWLGNEEGKRVWGVIQANYLLYEEP